jgi:catechol 2,3-dioxygenase-like lactoylglutathione lyase family enzyme
MNSRAGSTIIEKAIPVLPSLNFDASLKFYVEKLGFNLSFRTEDRLALEKNGLEIHFWPCEDKQIPAASGCFVVVRNIEPLYEEYRQQGVVHPKGALEDKPWGMRQFSMLDGDGNLIQFAESLKK